MTQSKKPPYLASKLQDLNESFGEGKLQYLLKNVMLTKIRRKMNALNGIITQGAALVFLDKVIFRISKEDNFPELRQKVEAQDPNSNGFDIRWDGGNGEDFPFLAEVKCNIPVSKNRYGAKQEEGIQNDIDHLMNGRGEGDNRDPQKIRNYYKFLILLNNRDKSFIRQAAEDVCERIGITPVFLDDLENIERAVEHTDQLYIYIVDESDVSAKLQALLSCRRN